MTRRAIWSVPVLLLAIATGGGVAGASLPSGVTPVTVTAGNQTANIDGHLHAARKISGTIRTSGGQFVTGIVAAYLNGRFAASGFASNGQYTINGLFARSYTVCMGGQSVFSPSSSTGFLGRCYKTAAFNGSTVPSNATLVNLAAGDKAGVNFSLPAAAAITGKVTNPSGSALANVAVQARNRSTKALFFGFTSSNGTYSVKGLTASATGYNVCFAPFVNSGTGYLPRCYRNKSWNGSSATMTGTVIAVALGHVHGGVNQALPRAGAISGKVVDAGNGKAIANDGIVVFSSTGHFVAGTSTRSTGTYVVRGLAASSGYRVCAAPRSSAAVVYHGRCWRAIAYNGGRLPAGTSPISVTLSHTHTGVNFRLTKTVYKLGSIAGTVTEQQGGHPLHDASVAVYTSGGGFAGSAVTDVNGHYRVGGLRAYSAGYVVCVRGDSASSTVATPTSGWAPRCYVDVPWSGLGVPSTAKRLPLSAGQNRTGINVALRLAGEIDGTTFQFGSTTPATNVTVKVFTTGGRLVTLTTSDFSTGTYSVKNLPPGQYDVCFDGRQAFLGNGFLPQCYNGVAWTG